MKDLQSEANSIYPTTHSFQAALLTITQNSQQRETPFQQRRPHATRVGGMTRWATWFVFRPSFYKMKRLGIAPPENYRARSDLLIPYASLLARLENTARASPPDVCRCAGNRKKPSRCPRAPWESRSHFLAGARIALSRSECLRKRLARCSFLICLRITLVVLEAHHDGFPRRAGACSENIYKLESAACHFCGGTVNGPTLPSRLPVQKGCNPSYFCTINTLQSCRAS